MNCQQIESLLPPFVDGSAGPDEASVVSTHLAKYPECRQSAKAQRSIYRVMQLQETHLSVGAPPGLRTRIAALAREPQDHGVPMLGWRDRMSAFAAAAVVILIVGAAVLPMLTARSTVLLAAQLALDHLKCFVIDGDASGAPIASSQAEATLKTEYGWSIPVRQGADTGGLQLMAVRRCIYAEGRAAHLLYRLDGEPVSLFIMPGRDRRLPADVSVLGHDEIVWTQDGATYVLMARSGDKDRLERVASRLRNEAE